MMNIREDNIFSCRIKHSVYSTAEWISREGLKHFAKYHKSNVFSQRILPKDIDNNFYNV
jgi:hypothetical protein